MSIPQFQEIVDGTSQAPYSRVQFLEFARKQHCSENLEFIINAKVYLQNQITNSPQQNLNFWRFLYDRFLSTDSPHEINLNHELKCQLDPDSLPTTQLINNIISSLELLLLDSYKQFISSINNTSKKNNSPNLPKVSIETPTPTPHPAVVNSQQQQTQIRLPSRTNSTSSTNNSPFDSPITPTRSVSPMSTDVIESETNLQDDLFKFKANASCEPGSFSSSGNFLKKLRWRRHSSNSSNGSN